MSGCATICLYFIWEIRADLPENSPWVSFWIAAAVNVAIFFTPLVDRPTSRGEIMLFALPDAIVVLGAGIVSYPVNDDRQRAVRQTMILGLVVAVVFCSILYALILGYREDL